MVSYVWGAAKRTRPGTTPSFDAMCSIRRNGLWDIDVHVGVDGTWDSVGAGTGMEPFCEHQGTLGFDRRRRVP